MIEFLVILVKRSFWLRWLEYWFK